MAKLRKTARKEIRGLSRRRFLGAAGAAAGFTIVPRYVLGAAGDVAASEKLNVAIIGTGGQGIRNIKNLLDHPDVRIIAICDVNEQSDYSRFYYKGTAGSTPALKIIEDHYSEQQGYKGCALYIDYRKMLEKEKNIDAVLVATPDHVHSVATMAAIKAGKGVYCEKPLAHSIYEVRKVTEAAREAKVATQMGNQGHSGEGIRLTAEWIRDGAIGPVRQIHGWTGAGGEGWTKLKGRPKDRPAVPSGFNWDLWLGPVKYRPYHLEYAPYNWRGWWDFGTGAIGDMACHNLDPAFWALDLGHPVSVESSSTKINSETTPAASIVRYKFAARGDRPEVDMTWYDGGLMPKRPEELEEGRRMGGNGILFVGDKGKILCGGWADMPRIIPEVKMKAYNRPARTLARSKGHHRDWIDACKGGKPASSNFDVSGPLTEVVLLGNIAQRTGKKLYWDPVNIKATNAAEADEFIRPEFRQGWSL
jgi:predicted dehydrogenase